MDCLAKMVPVLAIAMSLGACTPTETKPEPAPDPVKPDVAKTEGSTSADDEVPTKPADSPETGDGDEEPAHSRFGQAGKKLNPGIAGVGTEAFEAVFPEKAGGFARTMVQSSAAGTAGRWADSGMAVYTKGDREVTVHVTDMIRVSDCEPGKWAAHLEDLRANPKPEAPVEVVEVGKYKGTYIESKVDGLGDMFALTMKFGDRCALDLSSEGASRAELVGIAQDLALDPLEATCAKRDPGGLGPGF